MFAEQELAFLWNKGRNLLLLTTNFLSSILANSNVVISNKLTG